MERNSKKYGLALNKEKCVNLNMNTDEEQVSQMEKRILLNKNTVYLGNELNTKANIGEEVSNIIREVSKTWFRLNEYWKAANASRKWKIIVFDAVIRSKLL